MTSQPGSTVSAQGADVPLPRMATPAESPLGGSSPPADARSRDALRSRDR
jgi:hypothetical protein